MVITIILLLILAGITISQLTGSGLFENARLAEQKHKKQEMKEQLVLSIQQLQIEKIGAATLEDLTQEWVDKTIKDYEKSVSDIEIDTIKTRKITMTNGDFKCTFVVDEKLNILQSEETNYPQDSTELIKVSVEIVKNNKLKINFTTKEEGNVTLKVIKPDNEENTYTFTENKNVTKNFYEIDQAGDYIITIIDGKGNEKIITVTLEEADIVIRDENWDLNIYTYQETWVDNKQDFIKNTTLEESTTITATQRSSDILPNIDYKWSELSAVVICKNDISINQNITTDDEGIIYFNGELIMNTINEQTENVQLNFKEGYNLIQCYIKENTAGTYLKFSPELLENEDVVRIIPYTQYLEMLQDITDTNKPTVQASVDELGIISVEAEDNETGIRKITITDSNGNETTNEYFENNAVTSTFVATITGNHIIKVEDMKGNITTTNIDVQNVILFDNSYTIEYFKQESSKTVTKEDLSSINISKVKDDGIIEYSTVESDIPNVDNIWVRLSAIVVTKQNVSITSTISIDDNASVYLNNELITSISNCGSSSNTYNFKAGYNLIEIYMNEINAGFNAKFDTDFTDNQNVIGIMSLNKYVEQLDENTTIAPTLIIEKYENIALEIYSRTRKVPIKQIEVVTPSSTQYLIINNEFDINKLDKTIRIPMREAGTYEASDENKLYTKEDFTDLNTSSSSYKEAYSGKFLISDLQNNVMVDYSKMKTTFYIVCFEDITETFGATIDDLAEIYVNGEKIGEVTSPGATVTNEVEFKEGYNFIEIYWFNATGSNYITLQGDILSSNAYIGITSTK